MPNFVYQTTYADEIGLAVTVLGLVIALAVKGELFTKW